MLVEVVKRVLDPGPSAGLIQENLRLRQMMVEGVKTSFLEDGEERHAQVRLIDWEDEANDWRAINQFDVVGKAPRRPDIVIFLNGMPLVVIELKRVEGQDIEAAFNQIETYKTDIPDLFRTTLINVISDGLLARYDSLSAGLRRFMSWRAIDGETLAPAGSALALETLARGLLSRPILLDLLRWCVVFEDEGKGPIKKVAGYHQFFAIRKAVEAIRRRGVMTVAVVSSGTPRAPESRC